MSRWLITGAAGQVGRDLLAVLAAAGETGVTGWTRADVDLSDEPAVRRAVADWAAGGEASTNVIVNAAAYTAVDAAESDEATARRVSGDAVGWISGAANGRARLIQLSTDYVFPGDATTPYQVDDPTGPRSAYGRTKLAGERAALAGPTPAWVVRTSWVYSTHGGNFVDTMLRLEATLDTVDVVDDQHGSPTWSADLARGLVELGTSTTPPGILHATGSGQTTWFGLARAVFAAAGADPDRVRPTTTDRFPRPAPRPAYSVLDNDAWSRAGLTPLPAWEVSVRTVVTAIRNQRSP